MVHIAHSEDANERSVAADLTFCLIADELYRYSLAGAMATHELPMHDVELPFMQDIALNVSTC